MNNLDLGKDNIKKLLLTFSIPCVISMLVNSIYNIVDQIFIGKGVGTLGNAATNVIFPLVIIFSALASLIGNGASANLSLKLGSNQVDEGSKCVGASITLTFIVSFLFSLLAYIFLPTLVYLFGCTENVYQYAIDYGRIIILGAPFMMIYSSLSSVIRADGSPKYSMMLLVLGAIINIILDPIFIFTFNMGVKGGAIATVIGQVFSFILAVLYLRKTKSIHLTKESFKLDSSIFKSLALGASSFITQVTVLVLFVYMNNMLTKFGASSKYGADIPLSAYGIVSKISNLYISTILGIAIGSQPIVGFNYGARKYDRVKETIKRVLTINIIVGIVFNLAFYIFPSQLVSLFITKTDANYELFMEFAILICRTFLMAMALNAVEISTSVVVQSLGNVKKATACSFIRQIILFIPISLILCIVFDKGVNGILLAGPIADIITFFISILILRSEFKKFDKPVNIIDTTEEEKQNKKQQSGKRIVVTISREYGTGGRYVGKVLAKKLGINFYDKELIHLASIQSGLSEDYIASTEQTKKNAVYENNNDDRIFQAESKVIKNIAKKESCVIIGRCANYILKKDKNVVKVFLYTSEEAKVKRAVKYYGLDKDKALRIINKKNKERSKHYKYYTNEDWKDFSNYDLIINVDKQGIDKTADLIAKYIEKE